MAAQIFPYPVIAGALNLRVLGVTLDGVKVLPDLVDAESHTISISALSKPNWEVLSLRLRVDAPLSELASKGAPWSSVGALAILNCSLSNTRVAIDLIPDGASPARWEGTVDLDRAEWFGSVSIGASLTAIVNEVPCRAIGSAERWLLSLEDLPRPPIGQAMTIAWERFRNPKEPQREYLKDYADEAFFVRIDSTDPILFLNRDFEGLEGLLSDRRRRPSAERALHDQARGSIATEAWLVLFLDALGHAELDGEDVSWPDEPWRVSVLRSVLESAYGATDDETLRKARSDFSDADTAGGLLERALPAAGRQARYPRLLRNAIRTLPRVEDTELPEDEEAPS